MLCDLASVLEPVKISLRTYLCIATISQLLSIKNTISQIEQLLFVAVLDCERFCSVAVPTAPEPLKGVNLINQVPNS